MRTYLTGLGEKIHDDHKGIVQWQKILFMLVLLYYHTYLKVDKQPNKI